MSQPHIRFDVPHTTSRSATPNMDSEGLSTQDDADMEDLMRDPAMLPHWIEVHRIAKEGKEHYRAGRKFRIYHGSTNSTRPTASKSKHIVDTSRLNKVLRIDNKMRAIVQPNVPMVSHSWI